MNRKTLLVKHRLEDAFKLFDKVIWSREWIIKQHFEQDGNGELTQEEIKELFNPGEKNINDEEWGLLIEEIDQNGDQKVITRRDTYLFNNMLLDILQWVQGSDHEDCQ